MDNKQEYIEYTTRQGQRWDSIAYEAYGNPGLMNKIIEANVDLPITDRLAGGLILRIPIIEEVEVKTDKELLPPWKQQQ
jgi:phage tail protein X